MATADPNDLSRAERWEQRYGSSPEYLYGTEPNDFLAASADALPPGDALCIADGEGRNGAFLASLGHNVTSVDLTEAGMAKAARLAEANGVELTTVVADLTDFDFGVERWDLIVSVFAHTEPVVRRRIHGIVATALRPNGRFILEAYTPDQVGRGTGGPPTPELTMTLDGLRQELTGMVIESGVETVRPVIEGTGHTGDGAVVQLIAARE